MSSGTITQPAAISTAPRGPAPVKDFCEFFAGIGLVRLGLADSGWNCVFANDLDEKKQQMYERHFGPDEHYCRADVWNTDEIVAAIPGQPFLATASFPCVDLSLAGHWKGFSGEHSSSFFGFTRALQALGPRKPSLLLVENVAGFVTSKSGRDFVAAAQELAGLGYWLDAFYLDARHFVPQSRPRVFVVGVQADCVAAAPVAIQQPGFTLNDPWQQAISANQELRPGRLTAIMRGTTLKTGWMATRIQLPNHQPDGLETVIDCDDSAAWWKQAEVDRHYAMMSERHREQVDQFVQNGERRVGTIFRRQRRDKTRAEVRFDGLAGCLRTPRGGSAKQIVIAIDRGAVRMRWMSAVEYARLQGAADFRLLPNERQMMFGFGDAVCVPAIRWIDHCVLGPIHAACVP